MHNNLATEPGQDCEPHFLSTEAGHPRAVPIRINPDFQVWELRWFAGLEVAIILAGGASQLGQLAVCFHTRNGSAQCTEALVCPDQRWPLAWRFRPSWEAF